MVNEFLLGCRHRRGTSFCLQCRQQKVSDMLHQNLSTAQLEIQVEVQDHTHRSVPAEVSSKYPLYMLWLVVEVAAPVSERFRSTQESSERSSQVCAHGIHEMGDDR